MASGKEKVKATSTESKKVSSKKPKEETVQQEQVQKAEEKAPKKVNSKEKAEKVKAVEQKEAKPEATDDTKFSTQYLETLDEMKKLREAFQTVSSAFKKLESAYKHDIKKVRKHKQKRNGPHVPTGFAKEQAVPEKLAKFIKVKAGSMMTGPRITSAVWKQLTARGLTFAGDKDHKSDKRVFRTNTEVTELFGVPASVNKSTNHQDKNGFNFCNLQKFIANAMKTE